MCCPPPRPTDLVCCTHASQAPGRLHDASQACGAPPNSFFLVPGVQRGPAAAVGHSGAAGGGHRDPGSPDPSLGGARLARQRVHHWGRRCATPTCCCACQTTGPCCCAPTPRQVLRQDTLYFSLYCKSMRGAALLKPVHHWGGCRMAGSCCCAPAPRQVLHARSSSSA